MGHVLDLLAALPVNANLRKEILAFEEKVTTLTAENSRLLFENAQLTAENVKLHKKVEELERPQEYRPDPAECVILNHFIASGRNTVELPTRDPVVSGMIMRGLLRTVGRLSLNCMTTPMQLTDLGTRLLADVTQGPN